MNGFCQLVPLEMFETNLEQTHYGIFNLSVNAPIQRATQSLLPCVLFSIFLLKVQCSFLFPPWTASSLNECPQAQWVLKEVSLLWQCVDSHSLSLWDSVLENSSTFFLRFSLTCKHWSVFPLGQAVQCLILLSMVLMHFMKPLVLRLHYFKCPMGKYFHSPSHSDLVCCCFEL